MLFPKRRGRDSEPLRTEPLPDTIVSKYPPAQEGVVGGDFVFIFAVFNPCNIQ